MKRLLFSAALVLGMASAVLAANPGGSSAYGRSLEEWMTGAWAWLLGGSSQSGDRNVVYLPLPAGEVTSEDPFTLTGETDFTLRTGKAFALPMFFWIGEEYADGSQDDPAAIDDSIFTGATVEVTLDGRVILSSDEDDVSDYLVGPSYFDAVIDYAEPTSYGATGAVWIKGIGFVNPPLSRGSHTLHLYVYSPDFNLVFDNTWHLTVTR